MRIDMRELSIAFIVFVMVGPIIDFLVGNIPSGPFSPTAELVGEFVSPLNPIWWVVGVCQLLIAMRISYLRARKSHGALDIT